MPGNGCDLAVRIDGQVYYVDGSSIDDHGDAHAKMDFVIASVGGLSLARLRLGALCRFGDEIGWFFRPSRRGDTRLNTKPPRAQQIADVLLFTPMGRLAVVLNGLIAVIRVRF